MSKTQNIAESTNPNDYLSLNQAIMKGDIASAEAETRRLLDSGVAIQDLLDQGLIATMDQVGEDFARGEIFIPQMLRSAKTMQACIKIMEPFFKEKDVRAKGRILIGTVKGDLHDIGKNLVGMMLEGAGFTTVDLGVDVSPEMFVERVKEDRPDVIAMSALLTTTMPSMSLTIQALKEAGLRDGVKVLVGGAPVTEKFAESIQADGYAADAGAAVFQVKTLLNLL